LEVGHPSWRVTGPVLAALLLAPAILAGPVAVLSPAQADCSTDSSGCVQVTPSRGPVGSRVDLTSTVAAACEPPWISLYQGGLVRGHGASAALTVTGEESWRFTVPKLPPGTWKLAMFCPTDGGPIGATPLHATFVIVGAPDTSTEPAGTPPAGSPVLTLVALVAGVAGAAAALARTRERR
jgi:hypothetical protein